MHNDGIALHHVSLLVAEVARAREFYEGLLGLVPDPARPAMPFDGVWYSLGAVQLHLLRLPDPESGLLRPQYGGRDRHVALLVRDWDALRRRLTQSGLAFTLSQSGRDALFCRDPDGNALELIASA